MCGTKFAFSKTDLDISHFKHTSSDVSVGEIHLQITVSVFNQSLFFTGELRQGAIAFPPEYLRVLFLNPTSLDGDFEV